MMETRGDRLFRIVGIDDHIWNEFCSWFTDRMIRPPPYVVDGLFVVRRAYASTLHEGLLAGCCIYPCDGPYAVVEHAATNPKVRPRVAYEAMLFGAKQLTSYGAMRKKTMLCFPVNRGMERILEKACFAKSKAPLMMHGPWSEG